MTWYNRLGIMAVSAALGLSACQMSKPKPDVPQHECVGKNFAVLDLRSARDVSLLEKVMLPLLERYPSSTDSKRTSQNTAGFPYHIFVSERDTPRLPQNVEISYWAQVKDHSVMNPDVLAIARAEGSKGTFPLECHLKYFTCEKGSRHLQLIKAYSLMADRTDGELWFKAHDIPSTALKLPVEERLDSN